MLWDPDGAARKPPREAADILISVERLFGLSETFQRATNPDFVLETLGGTSRGAIERAYDWLIPIISRLPATIERLPSSASCFLLLRAYGTEGEERSQLKELSAPLLSHVAGCLKGSFGESESVKAFDLLMSDVASHKADRRRCARRVIGDALVPSESTSDGSQWASQILDVKYAAALVSDSIKYMVSLTTKSLLYWVGYVVEWPNLQCTFTVKSGHFRAWKRTPNNHCSPRTAPCVRDIEWC